MGRGQELLNLVKSIKQEKELQTIQEEIKEVVKPENLKAGVTAFGIEGNKNIVDTSDGNLYDYYLHPSYTGYSKGNKIRGRMPLSTEDQLQYFSSTQTMLNPEYPNFILVHHYPAGTIKGEIKTISANAINSEWIENKNICVRANYNPSLTYWNYDWRVEIAVCESDCQFKFKNSSSEQPIYCVYKATGSGAPYTLYSAWCNNLSELTVDSWEKNDIAVSNYMNSSLGKIGTLYAYSRDASVKTTGLTGSTGIMSSKGKIYFKNKLGANTTPAYLNNNNGAFIDMIDENQLAQFINLIPEHIKKGETYLGVEGALEIPVGTNIETVSSKNELGFFVAEAGTYAMVVSPSTNKVTGLYKSNGMSWEPVVEELDTSDATATADEIVKGKTAYINGEKVTGTFLLSSGTTKIVYGDKVELVDGLTVRFRMDFDKIEGFQKGSYLMLQADIDSLRNAIGLTADKIKKGETILGVAGTYEGVTEDITHSGGTND